MEGLTEGRIVHYVLESGEHRPAIVVRVWRDPDGNSPENGLCNLQVFTDSNEDGKHNDNLPPVFWQTSIEFSEDKRPWSWHWIEKA